MRGAGSATGDPPTSPTSSLPAQLPVLPSCAADAIAFEQTDLHTLYVVLGCLKQLCGEPQMVADLFVNYDCDPHAPPLFERTVQVCMC